jgi:hypothetical protein
MHPLGARLSAPGVRTAAPKYNLTSAASALSGAHSGLSIKGAGNPTQNTVEIKGLVAGTTAEDVKVRAPPHAPRTHALTANPARRSSSRLESSRRRSSSPARARTSPSCA